MKETYAVFVQNSYHVPGDERSRQAPGHGYPAHNVSYTEVIEFKDVEELKAWVVRNKESYGKKKFKAVKVIPVTVREEISIVVE